ncbi:MAG: N-acetyltransferase [Gaiella sp.]
MSPFVPPAFAPPTGLEEDVFVLEPLGPEHNERDHDAWMGSIDHIRTTPGFGADHPDPWPVPMTLEENLADLEMHARHFRERVGFTYTVLDPATRAVIGCVYVYPDRTGDADAVARSWVTASRAELDAPLWRAVSAWLASEAWPFARVRYAERATG